MTAKNKELIENWLLLGAAKRLKRAGFISPTDLTSIKSRLQLPKSSNNVLIRIGFFLLGCSLYSSIIAAASIFFIDNGSAYKFVLLFFSLIGLALAELLSQNNYHNSGLDDAFIVAFQIVLFGAIGVLTESPTLVFLMMTAVGLASCIRYFSTISMLFALLGVSCLFGSVASVHHFVSEVYLPFIMLLVAVMLYIVYQKISNYQEARLYRNSIRLIKHFSLILGYLSMNYLVVRELSEDIMGIKVNPGDDIPFAYLFYFMTFAIPAFYLTFSIMKRDRSFLLIGLVAFAFSIFSIRYYHHMLPLESALIFGGAALFGASYFFMIRIRNKDSGITFKADRFADSEALTYAQAAIATSHAQVKSTANSSPMGFGGGDFSGGGSSGGY